MPLSELTYDIQRLQQRVADIRQLPVPQVVSLALFEELLAVVLRLSESLDET